MRDALKFRAALSVQQLFVYFSGSYEKRRVDFTNSDTKRRIKPHPLTLLVAGELEKVSIVFVL